MKFGQPLISTELSGKLGGVVGATARGGVGYFRRRVTGSNPSTPSQAVARSILSSLSVAWGGLTQPQRDSWSAKAPPSMSGIDVYTRGNFQQLLTGEATAVATAPTSLSLSNTPMTDTGDYDISDEQWDAVTPAGTNMKWAMYLSKPQGASRGARQFAYQYYQVVDQGLSTIDIAGASQLSGLAAGQVFYVKMVPFGSASTNLGKVGEAQEFRVLAVA